MSLGWNEEFTRVNCPDDTVRYVLKKGKDMNRVFSLYLPEVNFLAMTSLRSAQRMAEGSREHEATEKTEQIFEKLDSVHIDAVNKFAMSYRPFMTSPCEKAAWRQSLECSK